MSTFVTKAQILPILRAVNPAAVEADIPDMVLNAMYDKLVYLIGGSYCLETLDPDDADAEYSDETLEVDGNGEKFIFVPKIPILSLTSVKTVSPNRMVETALTLTGESARVWVDKSIGKIQLIADMSEDDPTIFVDSAHFPERPGSVKVTGVFGSIPTSLVQYTQSLMVLEYMCLTQPGVYKMGLIKEEIGKYTWESSPNMKKGSTMRDMIDSCVAAIGKVDKMSIEGI